MGIVVAGSNGTVAGTVPKFATHDNFAMIAKFCYSLSKRKVLCIEKIEIFAMPVFFAMIAKITVCEIFCFCFFYPNDFVFGFSHF